jgi:hypothetical protein
MKNFNQFNGLLILALLFVAAAAGCRASEMRTPDGFVALDEDDIEWRSYQWKAVSPDGAAVVIRERENKEEGSLEFWSEALEREIVERQGYKLLDKAPVEGRNAKGLQMNFMALYGGQPYRYSVAVFANKDDLVTVELAADEAVWKRHEATLQAAVRSLELK